MIDISKLTDTELAQLKADVDIAVKKRRESRQKKLWVAILDAIDAYIEEFGEISVKGYEYDIDLTHNNYTSDTPGIIDGRVYDDEDD